MALTIEAMPAGWIRGAHGPASTYLRNFDRVYDAPLIMFAIRGGEHPILVDTGAGDADFVRSYHFPGFDRAPEEEPLAVLERHGIDLAEVRDVVFTHLHWDHCSNGELFPNATFWVQAAELSYAKAPLPWGERDYARAEQATPAWEPIAERMRTVDGEHEIAPGVRLIPLPGHTPGSQGVLVDTASGRYLIAGDTCHLYENWHGDGTAAHIPGGSFTNLHDYHASFQRIEALDCEVIPSHDAVVLRRGAFG